MKLALFVLWFAQDLALTSWMCAGGPWFNFAGFGKTEAEMKKLKLNEIKNGRLVSL
jgi:hypothetical protein